ncbi:MAG: penicillin acylase family protein [Myxococcales bacterium]|nr:penicillin acylase family protein [Myxococcales bacterium]
MLIPWCSTWRRVLVSFVAAGFCACDDDESNDGATDAARGEADTSVDSAASDAGPDAAVDMAPSVEGVHIPGLDGPVTVRFDEAGILHATCQTDADCAAVEGYYHAAHRFLQMDIRRRFAQGRLSEIVMGGVTLDTDREQRHLVATRDGGRIEERILATSTPESRALIDAYVRGVNAWLDDLRAGRNGARLSEEYDFQLIAKDVVLQTEWTALDTVACVLPLAASLTDDSGAEILAGRIAATQPSPERAFDLTAPWPASTSTILPQMKRLSRADASALARAQDRLRPVAALLDRVARGGRLPGSRGGSNNWVVGPDFANGVPLLANDPHLALPNPTLFYTVNLDAKSQGTGRIHIAGQSFPGLPGILFGQNEDIAWGVTTTYFDMSDVYVETLTPDGEGVMFNGQPVPFVSREFTFGQADGPALTESFLYVPHHGPVLGIDRAAGTALSLRWTMQDMDTDLDFIRGLAEASTVEEARDAVRYVTSAGQNFVVIDRGGHIGWFPYNRLPKRPWASLDLAPWMPLPGDGSAEWGAPIPYEDLPQAFDPPQGYIATANNDMTGAHADGDPTNDGVEAIQGFVTIGYRHERIVERIVERDDHDMASMTSIQADVHSLLAERTLPVILAAVDGAALSPEAGALVDALRAWDLSCPTGLDGIAMDAPPASGTEAAASIGCTAFHVLLPRLRRAAFADDYAEAATGGDPSRYAGNERLVRALVMPDTFTAGDVYWDDINTPAVETREEGIQAAVQSAAAWLAGELGADPDGWRWGRLHTQTLRADLFDAAGLATYNNGPFPRRGGWHTVDVSNATNDSEDDYGTRGGPSTRLVCAGEASGVRCTVELPGGQRHFRDSPHYDDLLQRWLRNQPTALPFSTEEVAAAAVEEVTVRP